MTKVTELGAMHLRNIYTADQAMKSARASIRAWAKEQSAERIRGYQAMVDHEVRLAITAGVPKRQVLETGLSTTSWGTLYESLARTEAAAADLEGQMEEPQASGPQFHRNDDRTITLTLLGEPFDKSASDHQWRTDDPALGDLRTWELDSEGYSLANTDYLADHFKRHPVGAWHASNLRIARDWAANN